MKFSNNYENIAFSTILLLVGVSGLLAEDLYELIREATVYSICFIAGYFSTYWWLR